MSSDASHARAAPDHAAVPTPRAHRAARVPPHLRLGKHTTARPRLCPRHNHRHLHSVRRRPPRRGRPRPVGRIFAAVLLPRRGRELRDRVRQDTLPLRPRHPLRSHRGLPRRRRLHRLPADLPRRRPPRDRRPRSPLNARQAHRPHQRQPGRPPGDNRPPLPRNPLRVRAHLPRARLRPGAGLRRTQAGTCERVFGFQGG